jgi:hypothetical protein
MTPAQRPNGRLVVEYAGQLTGGQAGETALPLDVIDQNLRSATPNPTRLVIGRPTEIQVPPGSYLVRCLLPSGEFMSAQAEVQPDAESRVGLRPSNPSPRENLGWAYLLKRIPRGKPSDVVDPARANLSFVRWEHRLGQDRNGWFQTDLKGDVDHSILQSTPYALAALTLEVPDGQTWLQVQGRLYPPRFVALPPAPQGQPVRVLIVRQGNDAQRREAAERPDPLTVLVSSGNLQAELLLGYLTDGSFVTARRIGDALIGDAERLVQQKLGDPSAAAVGGYYLLRAQKLDRLHDWTQNLDNWFPWLPDGAVIHAWHLLRQERPDVERARDRLLEAERRGVPLYTQGLRMLFDGLDLLARKLGDENLKRAWERVERYAVAANWRAMTTTFYGVVPSEPSPRPNAG